MRQHHTARRWVTAGAATAALAMAAVSVAPAAHAASPNITVDFGTAVRAVPRGTFSADITGYGSGSYLTNDPRHQAMLAGRYGSMRMELVYTEPGNPNSRLVAGGAGADTTIDGDDWVRAIKAAGAEPVLIVPENPTDAANMVRHFNTGGGNRVGRWIVGNESDASGEPGSAYSARFNPVYDAMKSVDPTILVGGPGTSSPKMDYLRGFLTGSGTRTDFVDFHKYGAGEHAVCDTQLLADTVQWENDVNTVREIIRQVVPARVDQIGIQVGELNTDWQEHPKPAGCDNIGDEPVQYRNTAIWWTASVFGHLARAGGWGYVYGDKVGALGLLYERPHVNGAGVNERMPAYQGLGFFTGQEGTDLAHFGSTLVASSTTLDGVEVFASANPKVVVIVNKNRTEYQGVVAVGPASTVTGHQKDGDTVSYAKPTPLGPLPVSAGTVALRIPGGSVTQLVVA